jgi:kinesin family protein 11
LDYAHRAKNIKNQPTINQRMTKKVVLKEYCAEIEQLKVQLQITREKNGVYVDPAEFYAMEGRIQTQENQIHECEAALRVRNEEVKSLKFERDDLSGRIDGIQKDLEVTSERLQEVSEKLEVTVNDLECTQVELLATEAVVSAQVETEMALHSQGDDLQREVSSRREDVGLLLNKVDRLVTKEVQRVRETQLFVGEIDVKKSALLEDLTTVVTSSKEESRTLCDGVTEMLAKGRNTCTTLKQAIDGALSTLIGDATTARDSMTSSCEKLETHLVDTNGHIAVTLRGLQECLSDWLGEVDDNMKGAQQQLAKQQTQA